MDSRNLKGINNFSEIGKLRKVLLHRIGEEVEGLIPDNFERLLFDDIPFLKIARQEHDNFAKLLQENGIETVYYIDETAKALKDKSVRERFVKEIVQESRINSREAEVAFSEYLMGMEPEALVSKVISGVKKTDIPEIKTKSLADYISSSDPFYMDPMPNLYFTRDPGACVGTGISIHHMSTATRRRESLLLKYMYKYNEDFSGGDDIRWYDYDGPESIEGGDILVLNDETVAVGLSERTKAVAIEEFAEKILGEGEFERVIVFDIPKCRAFMHLDTVFTMVDYDKFTIHPEIEGPLKLYEITLDRDGEARFSTVTDSLENILKQVLHLPAVDLIRCGGNDPMAAQREQWNDGSNTLCIAPGKVVTYERNYVTNALLEERGAEVLTIPSAELSRGRGGPRCMSCPVIREKI